MNNKTYAIHLVLIASLAFLLNWRSPLLFLANDSVQYIQASENLSSFFEVDNSTPISAIVRSPGFPILLATARLIGGGDLRAGYLILNFLFAAFSLVLVVEALKPFLPRLVSGFIILGLFNLCAEIFPAVLTEWTGITLLLTLYASWVNYLKSFKPGWLYADAVLISILIIIKPVFLFLVMIPILLSFKRISGHGIIKSSYLALCFSPLLALMILNGYRLGNFSISPAGSLSFFGVVAALGPCPLSLDDTALSVSAIKYLNEHRHPISRSDFPALSKLEAGTIFAAVAYNYELVETMKSALNLSWNETLKAVSEYNRRTVVTVKLLYIEYIWFSLLSLKSSLFLLIPSFILPLYLLREKVLIPVAASSLLFLFVHLAQVAVICCMGIIHNRYYNLTYFPLLAVSVVTAACFIIRVLRTQPVSTEKPLRPNFF